MSENVWFFLGRFLLPLCVVVFCDVWRGFLSKVVMSNTIPDISGASASIESDDTGDVSPSDKPLVSSATPQEGASTAPTDVDGAAAPKLDVPQDVDEFDPSLEEFAHEDFDFKMNALMTSFSDDMRDIVKAFREQQVVERLQEKERREAAKKARRSTRILGRADELEKKEQARLEDEALSKGVSMQLLRELKVAFEQKMTVTGAAGVDEGEFLTLFGASLCRGKSEEETRHWFRAIDQNCSGSIQWEEVSNYLVNYHEYAEKIKTKQDDYFVAKPLEPRGTVTTRKHHRQPIHKIVYSPALDVFYTCSNDGCVMAWNPAALKATHVVHKSSECVWVYDIALIAANNRLIVLQSDRCFFVYDCFMSQSELRYELLRVFATQGVTTKTFKDGSSYYECIDRKKVTGNAIITVDHSAVSERVMPNMIPATLLAASPDAVRCFDHVSGLSTGIGSGEAVVCGLESGWVEIYMLQIVSSVPIQPSMRLHSHSAMVTKVKYASELNGVISSSLDGTIVVTDIDIRQVVQRLVVNDPKFSSKPQFDFEYKTYHNMLLSWTSRTLHVWNALTGARLTHLSDHESPIIGASINVDRMTAYVLMENKTIKVWDVRNWRTQGEFFDETPRYCNDALTFLLWSPRHHFLLSGCSELFALRPRDVQERIDAGLVPSNRKYVGHLHRIRDARPIPFADHIVAVDTHDVGVWGVKTKKLLALWKWRDPEDHVMCFAVAPDNVRIAVGTETGILEMYNYACGFKIFSLLHPEPHLSAVTSILFLETSVNGGPPTCFASVGSAIHAWITEFENEDDLQPLSTYRYPDPKVIVWWMVCIDARRQTLAASFNNGEVQIISAVSMVCNTSMAFHSPADRLLSFGDIPSLFAAAHADGTIRFYLYDGGMLNLHPLIGFHAAFASQENTSCMTSHKGMLICGDTVGTVSIFQLGPLLDRQYVWDNLIPNLSDPFFNNRIRDEVVPFVELVAAFDTHESSVTSVSIVDDCLVTSGGDRYLRNWDLNTFQLNVEYGNPTVGPAATTQAKQCGASSSSSNEAYHSFLVTDSHYFHAGEVMVGNEIKAQPVGRLKKTLSYAKRGSVLAEELHRVRLIKFEQQQRMENGTAESDEPSPDEVEEALRREPSMLMRHRRRVSAVVGDFVLRDNPNRLKVGESSFGPGVDEEDDVLIGDGSRGDSPVNASNKTVESVARNSPQQAAQKSVMGRKESQAQKSRLRQVNALRPSRKALLWGDDDDDMPEESRSSSSCNSFNRSRSGPLPVTNVSGTLATRTSSSTLETARPAGGVLLSPLAEGVEVLENDSDASGRGSRRRVSVKYRQSPLPSPSHAMMHVGSQNFTSGIASPLGSSSGFDGALDRRASFANPSGSGKAPRHGAHPSSHRTLPRLQPLSLHQPPEEAQLFKIATEHVLKHQTTLVRTIPDKAVHSKLQEVMRIRQERQEMQDDAVASGNPIGGVFFRLPLQSMENGGQVAPPAFLQDENALDKLLRTSSS